ncbi:MAG TPA: beta-galactosidase, partial [Kiritimatiellia bacterium]|nr:beta-galactosidase [Kiritimatiellia bacterium]
MRNTMRVVLCVLAVLVLVVSVEAALPGFIKLKNGYFYDSVTGKPWVPRGIAYQTWNRPLGVWQTPDQLRYDLDEMVKMGANSIRVDFVWQHIEEQGDNIWSWANYDLLVQECEKRDIRIFALVGYQWPPNWFPDAWYTMHPPETDAEGILHTNRWQSDIIGYETPAARAQYAEFFTAVCSRYATNKAIAGWVLGNEYGYLGLWSGLLDGYDPNCEQAFRTWCQGKYTTIANANATWGTSYTNFNQLTFPEQYRAYGVEGAIWADAVQWREDSIAGYTAAGARAAKMADTNHLMSYSTVGMQWGEEDWRYHAEDRGKITAACAATNAPLDFFSVNNYPWSILGHESQNGQWGVSFTKKVAKIPVVYSETGFTSSETMWPGMDEYRQGPLIRNALWESLEVGAIGTHIFSWMDRPWITDREKGFGIVYADRSIKPAYWVCRDAYNLMGQAEIDDLLAASQDPKPDIAFLWTAANDSQYNRYECEMQQVAGALERLGYEPNFIDLNELGAGVFTNYRVVILPRNMRVEDVVPNSTNKTVLDFLRTVVIPKGVHVLAMADLPGLQNFNGKQRAAFTGEVSNLFGVDASDIGGFEAPMRRREYVSWYWAPIQVNFTTGAVGSVAGGYAYRPEVWKYSDEIKVTNGGVMWAQMDTLRNKGFEESSTVVTKWDGTWGNVQVRSGWGWQYDGLNMVQMWGDSGMWEDVPVVPFGRYTHSAYLRSNSDDPLSAGAYAVVQLEWRDEKGNVLGTNESVRLTGATPGNTWVQYKVDAIAPSNAWTGRRLIRCGLNATNGGTGSVYVDNKQWAPAVVVKNHGAGKSAIFLYSVGDNKPDGDGDGQPDVLPWKYRYDIIGAVVRDYFGVQPKLSCSGTNAFLCLPEYRTTSNNNVLIQMKNYAYNTSQPNGGADLNFTLNSSLLTGKTVRALEQGKILEQNSDGVVTVSLAPDGSEMLYAYTPVNTTNQVVQISDAPSVVHPFGDKVYTLKVKYDCLGRTDLRVRLAFQENGDNGDGVSNEIYQVLTNKVSGSGEQWFFMWIPDANRADTDYKSTPDGGKYQFNAWLETTTGVSVVKSVPAPTILEWGVRPTNALASTLSKGQTVTMNLEWEDLYESLWWRNTPQSRNDAYPGRVAVYRSTKTEAQFPGHLAKVNEVCDWLNSLGYSQANPLDIGFDNVIVTGLFSNDFNTGSVSAWTRAAGAMNWGAGTTTSGYLRVSRIGNDDNILSAGLSTWGAVTVSADVRYNKQDPYFSDIELFPKYVDRNNYFKVGIRNYYGFWRIKYLVRVNGVIHQQGWLKEFPKTNRPVENVWYNLKVAQSGSTNNVYFNNSLVGVFYATNFPTGKIALGTRAAQLGIWEPQKGYFFIDDDENGFSADLNTNGLPLNLDWGYLQQFFPTLILPGTYVMNDQEALNLNTWMTNGVHGVLATDGSVAMRNETGAADLGRVESLFGVSPAIGSISGITQVVIGTNDHYVTLDYVGGASVSASGTGRPYTTLTRGRALATVHNGSSAMGLIANIVTNNPDAPGKALVFNFAADTSGQLTNGLRKLGQRAFEWLRNDANKVRVELKYVSPLGNPSLDLLVYSTNVWVLSGSGMTNLLVGLPTDGLMTGDGKFYWSIYTYPWDATNSWLGHNGFYSSGNDTAPLISIPGKGLQILGVTDKAFAGRDWDMWAVYNTRTTAVTLAYGIKDKGTLQDEDNFNDGDYAGWNLVASPSVQWSVVSSALQARVSSTPYGYAYIYRNGLNATGQNVTVEYDTLFTGGAYDGGVIYRGRVLYVNPNACGWADNAPNYYATNRPATGVWNHVVMHIRDGAPYLLSDLFVNGRVVFLSEPIETTSWTTNTIGFLSPYSNVNAVVQWDNVRIADEQYSIVFTNVMGEYVPTSATNPTFWPSVPDYDPDMLEHDGTAGGARYEWYLYARGEGLHSYMDGTVYFSPRLMVEVASFPTNLAIGANVAVPVQWESLSVTQVPARLRVRLFDAYSGVIYLEKTATVSTVSGTTNIAATVPSMPSGSNYVWSTFMYPTNAVDAWQERIGSDDTFRFNELGIGVEPETMVTLVGPQTTSSVFQLYSDAGTLAGSSIYTWQGAVATFNGNYADATAPEGAMSFFTTGTSWQGWGIFKTTNLAAYSNGYLKFSAKSTTQLKVDLEGPQNTKGTVYITSTTNQWREFILPITSFANIRITNMYGLFEITGESAASFYVDNVRWELTATPPNQAPVVSAGLAQTITLPSTATLAGTATDDGLPSNRLTVAWTKVSGPGTVTFTNAATANTRASFSTNGVYVLRLTANDTALSTSDDIQITVNAAAPVNQAPVVNAGVDQTITLPSTATLAGTATDDGLPSNRLTVAWTKVSGPGT